MHLAHRAYAAQKHTHALLLLYRQLRNLTEQLPCSLRIPCDGPHGLRVMRQVSFHTDSGFTDDGNVVDPRNFDVCSFQDSKKARKAERSVELVVHSLCVTPFPGKSIPCIHFNWSNAAGVLGSAAGVDGNAPGNTDFQYANRQPGFELRVVTPCSLDQLPIDHLVLDHLISKGLLSIGKYGCMPVHSVVVRDELMGFRAPLRALQQPPTPNDLQSAGHSPSSQREEPDAISSDTDRSSNDGDVDIVMADDDDDDDDGDGDSDVPAASPMLIEESDSDESDPAGAGPQAQAEGF